MTEKLLKLLENGRKSQTIVGLKTSFEDEGVTINDLIELRIITSKCDLPLYVKIGGCEAKTDIMNCKNYLVDGIVCPMIESDFALEKFIRSCKELGYVGKLFANLETKTSFENMEMIINSPSSKDIHGYTVGRSDFVASYGLSKKSVNDDSMLKKVKVMLEKIKKIELPATMGGNLTSESEKFIREMFELNLLQKIETRNIIMRLSNENLDKVSELINEALYIETLILENRKNRTSYNFSKNIQRLKNIHKRIK